MLWPSECSPLPSSHFRSRHHHPHSSKSVVLPPLQSLCVCSSLYQELFSLSLASSYLHLKSLLILHTAS